MLDLGSQTQRRRIGLTPLIDVVFLLLVFFMLAARFGVTEAIPVALMATSTAPYDGPPRLVTVLPDELRLNGIAIDDPVAALTPLMSSPEDIVILRPGDRTSVQRLLDVVTRLRDAGLPNLVVLE